MTLPTPSEQQSTDLGRLILDSHQAEYKELSDNWRSLDAKAQGMTAIAGVFLAAAFAIARDAGTTMTPCQKVLLVLAIVALMSCVLLAVLALRVRFTSLPPIGEQFEGLVADIRDLGPDQLAPRIAALVNDQSKLWKEATQEVCTHNESKAGFLRGAVTALLVAALLVSALTIWSLF